MSIDSRMVARIADLARIEIAEAELQQVARELSGILGWIEQLAEVETADVAPMRKVMEIEQDWRRDDVTEGDRQEAITANAPRRHDGYFVVPKVVE